MADQGSQSTSNSPRTAVQKPRRGARSVSTPGTPVSQARSSDNVASASDSRRLNRSKKLLLVLYTIRGLSEYTLGDFLAGLFDPDAIESASTRSIVSNWLRGSTAIGTRPVEILEQIYSHPLSVNIDTSLDPLLRLSNFQQYRNSTSPSRSGSSVFSVAQNSGGVPFLNSRSGLDHWEAKFIVDSINEESEALVDVKGGLNRGAKLT